MGLKTKLRDLVADAKLASGISSNAGLAEALGISKQAISNAMSKTPSNAPQMISKPRLGKLMKLANYTPAQKADFVEAWLNWKIERTNDGGLSRFLLSQLKKRVDEKAFEEILRKGADLRHGGDKTGSKS